jgi:FHA domain
MPQLVVNPDTPEAWSIELGPGTISLGRSTDNDFSLDHPSVSSSHCQIVTTEQGSLLKDLGSTGGTFVDDCLVEQARLTHGQNIRLGEIALRSESPESASPPRVSGGENPPIPRRMPVQGNPRLQPTRRSIEPEPRGFLGAMLRAFLYPFQGGGGFMLLAGTAFLFLLSWLPLIGLILTGYFFSYAKCIIVSTAQGDKAPPDWPDFSDWKDDILVPYLQLIALVVLFFGPAYLIGLWHPGTAAGARLAFLAALAFGVLLAPMGMLALAMFDHVGALNPVLLTCSILRAPLPYLLAAAGFEIVLGIHVFAEAGLEAVIPLRYLANLISSLIYLYLMAVGMRMLGLLYFYHKEELGWFGRCRAQGGN